MDTLEDATRNVESLGFHLVEEVSSETAIDFAKDFRHEGWERSYGGSYDATTGEYRLSLGLMEHADTHSGRFCNDFANEVRSSLEEAGIGAVVKGNPKPIFAEAKKKLGIPKGVSIGFVSPNVHFVPELEVTGSDFGRSYDQLIEAAKKFGYHLDGRRRCGSL